LAVQEIIWATRPEVVVETGIARGGSLILSASLLELLGGDRFVVGVDIDLRAHNRVAIESHPLFHRIRVIEGSSVDASVVSQVHQIVGGRRALVLLDSNHTFAHVRDEIAAYAPLVKSGSYLVVFDTDVEDLPPDIFPNRAWGPGNNPRQAVDQFLKSTDRFVVDEDLEAKLMFSVAPRGYLKCIRD
jgi:cephalosporin hydroxylase